MNRLATPDPGRELATEFLRRQNIVLAEEIAMRPFARMGARAQQVWRGVAAQMEHLRETMRERMDL
jgi:hypothetical protein